MFSNKHKSKNPIGWVFDTSFDALLPKKQKPSHKRRNATLAVVIGSAVITGLTKRKPKP